MTDQTAFAIAVLSKWAAVSILGLLSYLLMSAGKDGWGWLVFLAVFVACTQYGTDGKETPE